MPAERSRKKPEYQVKIAKERIDILFDEAEKARKERPELARRYIRLAKRIGMRYNVRLPKHLKGKYCKYCYSFLPSEGRRLKNGIVRVKCIYCNKIRRYPYKAGKK